MFGNGSKFMKIAFVCARSVPANLGGADELARTNAKFLAAAGHDVTMLTSYINEGVARNLAHEEVIEGVRILRFRQCRFEQLARFSQLLGTFTRQPVDVTEPKIDVSSAVYHRPSMLKSTLFGFCYKWLSWIFSPGLFGHILCSDYDIIHVTPFPQTHIWFATRAANLAGIPVVLSPAYHVELQYNVAWQLLYLIQKVTHLVVFTQKERLDLAKLGVPVEKMTVVPPGIGVADVGKGSGDRFRSKYDLKRDPIILFAGVKGVDKGFNHVVDAMVIVRQTHPEAVFASIGRGSETLHNAISVKLPNALSLGFVSIEEKMDAFDACTIFIMPSRCDSFGIVYLEAWLCGKPVIGARSGVIPWVIHEGDDGELVTFGDVQDIADKLVGLLNDPLRCKTLGENGYQFVLGNYMEPVIVKQLVASYRLCLNAKGATYR
jgi:glycosyltransferase involved in cell wall biosynthesis